MRRAGRGGPGGLPLRWFVRGDVDGFFGLALDNLVQLLVIDALCRTCSGSRRDGAAARILPGVAAVSVLVGNLFYAWQAMRLAARPGRTDVCALPYGINTVSLFGYVFLVMLPAKIAAAGRRRRRPAPGGLAGRARRLPRLGAHRARGALVAERIRAGHAPRGAPLHARGHRARVHLARLPVPRLLAPRRGPGHPGGGAPHLLRPRAVPRPPSGRISWRCSSAPSSPGPPGSPRWARPRPRRRGGRPRCRRSPRCGRPSRVATWSPTSR